MRLDKFLQMSGVISRRTRAKEACDRGYVVLNGRTAKASTEVAPGQTLLVRLGGRELTFEVLSVPSRPVRKADRDQVVRLLGNETTF